MSSGTIELFPAPSNAASSLTPAFLPGPDADSTLALQSVLRDNHDKWHIFFNDKRLHNHITHHVLAVWALGASKEIIEAVYHEDIPCQKPAIKSPGPITAENFNAHLGDEKYFDAYMSFFKEKIAEKGTASVLEAFVFSESVNSDEAMDGNQQPGMLNRLLGGLVHPMIHLGYGLEFGLPGMVVEGMSPATVHYDILQNLLPYSALASVAASDALAEKATSLETPHQPSGKKGTHAFDVLARVVKDHTLRIPPSNDENAIETTVQANGEALFRYTNQWTLDLSDPKEINRKIEELQWMNTIIYAIGGSRPGKKFYADFFLMHLVTSALFLPSLVTFLSTTSQALLLRGYMAVSFAWWISRGRPGFDVPKFFEADDESVVSHSSSVTKDWKLSSTPNPWFGIIQQALFHRDDHLCKTQRALAYFAALYGTRPAGLPDFSQTELPGAEKLDGTLFLRAAQFTTKHFVEREDEDFEVDDPLWDFRLV
ncbi:uncharacterized protein BT62DRAFT_907957 [Guyanagaster necrorhizus]|uniref:Oxidoreductase AflY n=1 Tax=Guyanagaster necrorhizus TaxID=856835 RepID=A0A9P7VI27_9AGAR|nr:uncharacterized protein BT62DRAFT_907957 [Guyanagaster necrorhizus MCA 3950]KAG7441451.1 hypothetical protein BT62DRAFT_907957 [Guyanagaster necrorhizus MCA 3950]